MRRLLPCLAGLVIAAPATAQIWDGGGLSADSSSRAQSLLRTTDERIGDLRRQGEFSDQERRQIRRERRELRDLRREYRSADASERAELRGRIEAKGAFHNARLIGPAQINPPSPR